MPASSPIHADYPALIALGSAIRNARKERSVSQEALADLSGIDRSYMSSIERGKQNPGLVSIIRIAEGLGMSVAELMLDARL